MAKTLAIVFTLAVVWAQVSVLFPSGTLDDKGNLNFYDYVIFRDSAVHLSLISEMQYRFPPTNFAASGEPLKNYHYLYDAFLSIVVKLFPLNPWDLYFRIAPIALSLLLSLLIYLVTLRLSGDKVASAFAIFFSVFATSFGRVLPWLKTVLLGRHVTGGNNIFMTDQILGMMTNPQGVVSLIVFLGLFLLLALYGQTKKTLYLVFFSVLLGLSFGVKAYGGIVFASGAVAASVWFLLKDKDHKPIVATALGLAILVIWVSATIDSRVAGLQIAPLWILEKMMVDINRINEPRFVLLQQHFQAVGAWWWLVTLTVLELLIYLVGSLGLRLLGILQLRSYIAGWRKLPAETVFLLTSAFISFTLPLFFHQSKKAYDIVQFTTYFTLFMGIMFTISLFALVRKLPSLKLKVVVLVLMIVCFLLLDEREIAARLKGSSERVVISKDVLEATTYIKENLPVDSVFLLSTSQFNLDYLWFSSLTGRRTVYSGSRFAEQVGVDIGKLKREVDQLWTGGSSNLTFDYVLVRPGEGADFAKIESAQRLQRIYEKSGVVILKNSLND